MSRHLQSEATARTIKRFVKSYHEIRFNLNSTKYIPDFDKYETADKIEAIVALSSRKKEDVSSWDPLQVDQEFSRLISREVHDLEQDVGNPS